MHLAEHQGALNSPNLLEIWLVVCDLYKQFFVLFVMKKGYTSLNRTTIIINKSAITYSAASRRYNLGTESGLKMMLEMIVMIVMSSVGMS